MKSYRDKMERMFVGANEGLSRRMKVNAPFVFEDYTDPELHLILRKYLDVYFVEVYIDLIDFLKKFPFHFRGKHQCVQIKMSSITQSKY
jgi:hypothetical protein